MFFEVILRNPDTSGGPGAAAPRLIPLGRVHSVGKDPATGRAVVYLLGTPGIGMVAAGASQLPTYEQYDAVRARLATLGGSNPVAPVSSADEAAATDARDADAAASQAGP